jgi:ferritin-like metal-binding protein YciE
MTIRTFHDLLLHEMRDLYSAEHQILEALPRMADMAQDEDLRQAFLEHHKQTKGHIEKLERAFRHLEVPPQEEFCEGIEGIIKEGENIKDEPMLPEVRDAALICAAQKVEHYEITGYGTAAAYARLMKHDKAADIFEAIRDEESDTDEKLTAIAESTVNPAALEADPDMTETETEEESEERERAVVS